MTVYTPEQEAFILDAYVKIYTSSNEELSNMTGKECLNHAIILLKTVQEEGLLQNDYTIQSPCCISSMNYNDNHELPYSGESMTCDECGKKYSPQELKKMNKIT